MAGRIGEDPPAAGIDLQQGGAEAEYLRLSLAEVGHVEVQVELLRAGAVRPPSRDW